MPRFAVFLFAAAASAQSWVLQTSNSTASLRGVSAVDSKVVWASGTGGTYLHTTDGGATWTAAKVPGAETLDFRGIRAIDGRIVYLMSSGAGDKARIYKTTDAGQHWDLQFTNPDPKASSTRSRSGIRTTASCSAMPSRVAPKS
nr:glycosyl hydrolase [uncultured bacterium]